ncbi:hypothetical protein QQF64_017320 [Cirrhinus molitorella]|uniref:Uncharacterized protein n=1 Tax=Cirrhinus molitorella TaxID=172907 RepID=A0ABR3LLY2_9TELE
MGSYGTAKATTEKARIKKNRASPCIFPYSSSKRNIQTLSALLGGFTVLGWSEMHLDGWKEYGYGKHCKNSTQEIF